MLTLVRKSLVSLYSGDGHSEWTDMMQRLNCLCWRLFLQPHQSCCWQSDMTKDVNFIKVLPHMWSNTHTHTHTGLLFCPYEDSHIFWRFASEVNCDFSTKHQLLPSSTDVPKKILPLKKKKPSHSWLNTFGGFLCRISNSLKKTPDVWRTEPKMR